MTMPAADWACPLDALVFGNAALHLAGTGVAAWLVSRIGTDDNGGRITRELADGGMCAVPKTSVSNGAGGNAGRLRETGVFTNMIHPTRAWRQTA